MKNTCQSDNPSQKEFDELLLQKRMQDIGHKLLVLSGKGGVGKSTVAANLAIALASAGKSVGLLDVDVHGPSIPQLMGLKGCQLIYDGQQLLPVKMNDNLAVVSMGFMLPDSKEPVIWRGPLKFNIIRQFLKDVSWGRLDYLVIDSPPGTGDEPLSVAQLVGQPAGAIIVTTPQDLAVSDVRRCVSFCKKLSMPIIGILENMSGFTCPKCGETIDLFKTGGGKRLADEMNIPYLGQIPIDPQIVLFSDEGKSFIDNNNTASAKAFTEVVNRILSMEKQGNSLDTKVNSRKENH